MLYDTWLDLHTSRNQQNGRPLCYVCGAQCVFETRWRSSRGRKGANEYGREHRRRVGTEATDVVRTQGGPNRPNRSVALALDSHRRKPRRGHALGCVAGEPAHHARELATPVTTATHPASTASATAPTGQPLPLARSGSQSLRMRRQTASCLPIATHASATGSPS